MRAIQIIKNEHLNLNAALYSLERLVDELDAGKQPDFAAFHGLLTYIDRFLDRFHHPKENQFLFPKILERAPDSEALIKQLGQEHTEGEILLVEIYKALSAYEFGGQSEYPHFRDCVRHYAEFERNHALTEEKQLLPRAKQVLEPGDWDAIDAAFGENRDPMFGEDWKNEFSELFEQLVNRLPAPIGLGEVWK